MYRRHTDFKKEFYNQECYNPTPSHNTGHGTIYLKLGTGLARRKESPRPAREFRDGREGTRDVARDACALHMGCAASNLEGSIFEYNDFLHPENYAKSDKRLLKLMNLDELKDTQNPVRVNGWETS